MKQQDDIFEMYKRQRQEEEIPINDIDINEDVLWQKISQKLDQKPTIKPIKSVPVKLWSIAAGVAAVVIIAWIYNRAEIRDSYHQTEFARNVDTKDSLELLDIIAYEEATTYPPYSKPESTGTEVAKKNGSKLQAQQDALLQLDTSQAVATISNDRVREYSIKEMEASQRKAVYKEVSVSEKETSTSKNSQEELTTAHARKTPALTIPNNDGQPGSNDKVSIRGASSLSEATSPLIILDGAVYNGDLKDIDPNTIASIEILKDSASSALYGSRGKHGIIVVKSTKASKKEARKSKRKQKSK